MWGIRAFLDRRPFVIPKAGAKTHALVSPRSRRIAVCHVEADGLNAGRPQCRRHRRGRYLCQPLPAELRMRENVADGGDALVARHHLRARRCHQLAAAPDAAEKTVVHLEWRESDSAPVARGKQALEGARIFASERLRGANPRPEVRQQHAPHFVALAKLEDLACGVQLMRLEVEIAARFRQRGQQLARGRGIANHKDRPDRQRAKDQGQAVSAAEPVAMLEQAVIQVRQRVQRPFAVLIQPAPDLGFVRKPSQPARSARRSAPVR